jgi:hypothetical protein
MDRAFVAEIQRAAIGAYKDLLRPNFSFIFDRYKNRIYEDLLNELRNKFMVEDHTDFNYQTCYELSIKNSNRDMLGLNLSLVEPYGYLSRSRKKVGLDGHLTRPEQFIVKPSDCIDEFESHVFDSCVSHGIRMLSLSDLEAHLPITLFDEDLDGGKSNLVFHILFFRDRSVADA